MFKWHRWVSGLTWKPRWAAPPSGPRPAHGCGSETSWGPRPAPCSGSPFHPPRSWCTQGQMEREEFKNTIIVLISYLSKMRFQEVFSSFFIFSHLIRKMSENNHPYSKTSLLNCFCRLPRNSPRSSAGLRPFLCSRKWATPTGVSGMNPLSVRYWIPFSGFLKNPTWPGGLSLYISQI